MKNISFAFIACATVAAAQAQSNPGVAQADNTRIQRATDQVLQPVLPGDSLPPLYDGESEDVGPQSVLRAKKTPWFRATVDVQSFYTDNMLYTEDDEQSAGVAVTTLEAALMTKPCITRFASYRAELGYRHQFYNYFGNDDVVVQEFSNPGNRSRYDAKDFDFDSSTFFANLTAQTKHYQFGLGLDYTKLFGFKELRDDNYDEFYSEVVPRWSVQRNFRVCSRSQVSLAYLGSYHFTDEDQPLIDSSDFFIFDVRDDRSERWEHTFLAAYTVALPCSIAVQPYYRFQFNDFEHTDNYLVHTAGFSAGWYPCENFSVRGFVGYNWSDASDSRVVEYEKLDAGGGLTATLRF
jgi:hypothetical protein